MDYANLPYDAETDIFVIKDLELHEISVVSVAANAESLFSVRKSFEDENEYNEFKNSFIEVEEKTDDSSTNKKGILNGSSTSLQAISGKA